MPRTVASNFLTRAFLALAIALTLAVRSHAAGDDKAVLIMTANTRNVLPVIAFDPPVEDAQERLEKQLEELKRKDPDAYIVDAGNSIALGNEAESGYNYTSAKFFDEEQYDVVSLDSRDGLYGMIRTGYRQGPDRYLKPLISSIQPTQGPLVPGVGPIKTVQKDGQMPITFANLNDWAPVAGITGIRELVNVLDPAPALQSIKEAKSKGDAVVAFTSWSDDQIKDLVQGDSAPDLLVSEKEPAGAKVRKEGKSWIMAPPAPGRMFRVALERRGGELKEPGIKSYEYLTQEQYDGLITFPVPTIGFPLPELNNVVQRYFDVTADSVRIDRLDASMFPELTDRPSPNVYVIKKNGEIQRIYRVFFRIADVRYPSQENNAGWPPFDMLVVLDQKSKLLRVVNKTRFPIAGLPTTLPEALNKLAGEDPSEWKPDPVLAAGMEDDTWAVAVRALKMTIELDQKLYAGGDMPVAEPKADKK